MNFTLQTFFSEITRYCGNPSSPAYVNKLISILRVVDNNSWRVLKWSINIPVQCS